MPNFSKAQHRWKFANWPKAKARRHARHTPGGYHSLPERSSRRRTRRKKKRG